MAYTVDNVIDLAVERSNLNDELLFSTTELYRAISSFEQRAFLVAATLNENYYGREGNTSVRSAPVSSSGGIWDLNTAPGNVGKVSRVEVKTLVLNPTGLAVGDEVEVIDITDPEFGVAPRVYLRGKKLYEYNTELQESDTDYVSQLKVWYSYLPPRRSTGDDVLELDEAFVDLIVLPLARLMALRDQRVDEIPVIMQEYQDAFTTFAATVSGYDELSMRELSIIATPGAQRSE